MSYISQFSEAEFYGKWLVRYVLSNVLIFKIFRPYFVPVIRFVIDTDTWNAFHLYKTRFTVYCTWQNSMENASIDGRHLEECLEFSSKFSIHITLQQWDLTLKKYDSDTSHSSCETRGIWGVFTDANIREMFCSIGIFFNIFRLYRALKMKFEVRKTFEMLFRK